MRLLLRGKQALIAPVDLPIGSSVGIRPFAVGFLTCFDGPSELTILETVSLEIPSRLAIDRIDSPSAKGVCLTAPQSHKLIILHLEEWPDFRERFSLFFEERRH